MTRPHPRHLCLLLVSATFTVAASSQNLTRVDKSAPHAQDFAVYEDPNQAGTFVYAPLKLALLVDSGTQARKIGLQHFADARSKTVKVNVTAALQFVVDPKKLADLINWAKLQKGLSAKVGIMNSATVGCAPYFVLPGNKLALSVGAPYTTTFDASIQVTGAFTFSAKKSLGEALRRSDGFGFYCKVLHQKALDLGKSIVVTPDELIKRLQQFSWVPLHQGTEQMIDDIINLKIASESGVHRQLARPAVSRWLASIIDDPVPKEKLMGSIEWGWNFSTPSVQANVVKFGPLVLFGGDQLAYVPVKYAISPVNELCGALAKQVLDLDSGEVGCDGLK